MTNTPDTEEHWASKPVNLDSDNLLWKQYNTYVDIFKFYINVTWQVITWFYAITGAVLVYYFDHVKDNSYLRYALVLPAILSFGFYQIFAFGAQQNEDLVRWLNYIRAQLSLPGRPHVEILGKFLELSSQLFYLLLGVGYGEQFFQRCLAVRLLQD